MKDLFSNAVKGDIVWSDRFGFGKVDHVDNFLKKVFVIFESVCYMPYFLDGKRHKGDVTNELHWDKIEYIEPEKIEELG